MNLSTLSAMMILLSALGQADKAPPISDLIKDLGASSYAKREAATEALKKRGKEALKELREATKSDDPETSQRAAELIGAIESSSVSASQAVEASLQFENASVERVVQALRDQTGINVSVGGKGGGAKTITINQKEPMPFWKAIDEICKLGELTTQPPDPFQLQRNQIARLRGELIDPASNRGGLVLTPGKSVVYPSFYSGAYCVRLVKIQETVSGQAIRSFGDDAPQANQQQENRTRVLELMVLGRPGDQILFQDPLASGKLEAKDEMDRDLFPKKPQNPNLDPRFDNEANAIRLRNMQNAMLMRANPMLSRAVGSTLTIAMPILKPSPKTIKILKGTITGTTLVSKEPRSIDLDKAVGQKIETDSMIIDFQKFTVSPNRDQASATFSVTQKNNPNANDNQRLIGRNDPFLDDIGFGFPRNAPFQFVDANGNPVTNTSGNSNGNGLVAHHEYKFRVLGGGALPARMLIKSDQQVSVEIPFEFHDIPFPKIQGE